MKYLTLKFTETENNKIRRTFDSEGMTDQEIIGLVTMFLHDLMKAGEGERYS